MEHSVIVIIRIPIKIINRLIIIIMSTVDIENNNYDHHCQALALKIFSQFEVNWTLERDV